MFLCTKKAFKTIEISAKCTKNETDFKHIKYKKATREDGLLDFDYLLSKRLWQTNT